MSVLITSMDEEPETVLLDYDADGTLLADLHLIGPRIAGFLAPQLEVGSDGRRIVATDDGTGLNAVLKGFAADNSVLFEETFSLTGFAGVSELKIDDDDSFVLIFVNDGGFYEVRRYDAAGTLQWTHSEPGTTGLVLSDAFAAFAPNGDVIFAGSPELFAVDCVVTVKGARRAARRRRRAGVPDRSSRQRVRLRSRDGNCRR